METLATLRHGLHETEERLLTKLRALRRDLRRTQGRADQDGSQKPAMELTTGQRIADIVAATMGSWNFIIIQSIILLIWIILNVTAFMEQWDPYPFILLNLALSFQAAYAAPFIMMSQNRQQDIDRQAAEHDHQINIKAELEIELLHQKLDQLRETEVLYLTQAVRSSPVCCAAPRSSPARPRSIDRVTRDPLKVARMEQSAMRERRHRIMRSSSSGSASRRPVGAIRPQHRRCAPLTGMDVHLSLAGYAVQCRSARASPPYASRKASRTGGRLHGHTFPHAAEAHRRTVAAAPAAATPSGAEVIRPAPIQVETLTLSGFAVRVRQDAALRARFAQIPERSCASSGSIRRPTNLPAQLSEAQLDRFLADWSRDAGPSRPVPPGPPGPGPAPPGPAPVYGPPPGFLKRP